MARSPGAARFRALPGRALLLAGLAALLLGPLLLLPLAGPAAAQDPGPGGPAPSPGPPPRGTGPVLRVEVDGAITRATATHLEEALEVARREDAAAVLLVLNTPGGGLEETFEITRRIGDSPVPVIGYVAPSTAHAWSAGTVILLSTHLAAMAPHSVIGSSQPVSLGEGGFTPINDSKIINALVAQLRALAAAHGRNETAAEEFVTKNLNLNHQQALDAGVIELVAPSVDQLLRDANGREVPTPQGNVTLATLGKPVRTVDPSLRAVVLGIFFDPLVAGLLMLVGIYAIIFGLGAPGHGAEVAGVVAVLLALVGLGFNVSLIALGLIGLGAALLLLELHSPGFGVFGVAGLAALVLGSIFIAPLSPTGPGQWVFPAEYQQQVLLILTLPSLLFAGFLVFALLKVQEVRQRKPAIGDMLGEHAVAMGRLEPGKVGWVRFRGETWQARSDQPVAAEGKVVIRGKEGEVLLVAPAPGSSPAAPPPATAGASPPPGGPATPP